MVMEDRNVRIIMVRMTRISCIIEVVADLSERGFCMRGANCPFEHSDDVIIPTPEMIFGQFPFMPNPFVGDMGRGRGGRGRGRRGRGGQNGGREQPHYDGMFLKSSLPLCSKLTYAKANFTVIVNHHKIETGTLWS